MFTFLTILAILVCVFLILFILIQNPKGGGLSSNFGASNQIMGVQKTGDFLERTTWGLAIALLVICLSMKVFSPGTSRDNSSSELQKQLDKSPANTSPAPTQKPSASPAAVPSNPGSNPAASPSAAPLKK